ncbi:MAG: hypothetical protein GQ527_02075 [Bacteroidales bacterium]|nr:hypothetical protein [Bacteroidales bacterium]
MKKLFLFFFSLAILSSCQDDDNNVEPEPPNNSYRLKEAIIIESSGISQKYLYNYQDNRLLEGITSFSNSKDWTDVMKFEITYSGNDAELIYKGMPDTSQLIYLNRYEFENERPVKITPYIYNENVLYREAVYSFKYNNNLLIQYLEASDNGNELITTFKTDYIYNGNAIREAKSYYYVSDEGWMYNFNRTYVQKDGIVEILSSSVMQDSIYRAASKTNLYLSVNNISKIEHYYRWPDMEDWELRDEVDFIYNADGYIIEENYRGEIDGDHIVSYEYEEGKGNLDWFYMPNQSLEMKSNSKKNNDVFTPFLMPRQMPSFYQP